MPTQRLSMRRIREVLRLRHQGLTERVIAQHDRGEQWRRAWVSAASASRRSDLAAARRDGRRGPGNSPVSGAARRPRKATGDRHLIGLMWRRSCADAA